MPHNTIVSMPHMTAIPFLLSCNNLCEDGGTVRKRRSVNDQEEYHLYQGPLIRSTDDQSDAFGKSFLF